MIKFLIISSFLITSSLNSSVQIKESQVKASLIYKFAQFVEWNDESSIDTFKFAFLSQDTILINHFKSIVETNHLRLKPMALSVYDNISNYDGVNCVFIDNDYLNYLDEISRSVQSKNILLITENSPDLLLSMINIYKKRKDNTLKFDVNKQNLDNSGFVYNQDLLFYGGSLVDIKELYISTNTKLSHKNREIDSINKNIKNLNKDIKNLKKEEGEYLDQIEKISDEVQAVLQTVDDKEREVNELNESIDKKDLNLKNLNFELQSQEKQRRGLSRQLIDQKYSIYQGKANLQKLNDDLEEKRGLILDSEKLINNQSVRIETQKKGLVLGSVLGVSLIVIVILIVIALRTKRQLAKRLEDLVEKRTRELHDSQQYYFSLFENTPVAISEFDLSLLVEYLRANEGVVLSNETILETVKKIVVNDTNFQALQLYGVSNKSDFISNYHRFFNNESVAGLKKLFVELLSNNHQFEFEITRVSSKQEVKHLIQRFTIVPGGRTKYSKVLVSMTDVSKLKMYEQEILDHKNHLEDLVKERTKEIVKLNDNLFQTNDELIGTNKNLNDKNTQLHKQQQEISKLNSSLVGTNNKLEEQRGKLLNTVSQLKDTQNRLVESEKMASLGMLTAGVAHEINNPVNFISSGNQALEMVFEGIWSKIDDFRFLGSESSVELIDKVALFSKEVDDESYYSLIKEIMDNMQMGVTRITEIVSSLETYSQKSDDDEIDLDINKNIEAALVALEDKYKGIIEINKLNGVLPLITCSSTKLSHIFVSVLSNAFDAIDIKGVVNVTTSYIEKKSIVELVFEDDGKGMDKEVLSKVFEPFYTTKDPGKGTGLGMYITYGIIAQLKGTVRLESIVGKGTKVIINLPVNSTNVL